MIETHAHLHSKSFDLDRSEIVAKSFAAGIRYILEINIDRAGWPKTRALAESDRRIFASVGIHPMDVGDATEADLEKMQPELAHPFVLAVGETGLDYYRDYSPHDKQRLFFRRHVEWARSAGKPLVIHSRCRKDGPSTHEDALKILEEVGKGDVTGVFHCFSADVTVARRAVDLGFKLGFGGAISYGRKKNRKWITAIAAEVGLESFVLETDCPFLTPHPHQQERNDPTYIPAIVDYLAGYLETDSQTVSTVTDQTALELFGFERSARS